MLKVMELAASDNKEGVEEKACWWSRNIVVEEWGSRGKRVLT